MLCVLIDVFFDKDAQQTSANPTWQEHAKAVKDAKNAKAKRHGYKKPSWCMWPLNIGTQQLLLLGYATSLGQYQEVFCHFLMLCTFCHKNNTTPMLSLVGKKSC